MKIYWYQRGMSPTLNPAIGGAEIVSSSTEGVPAQLQAPSISPLFKVWIDVQPDDNSYGYRAIMEKPQLVLKFALPNFIEIPVGAWCDFMNHRYYLRCPEDIKKQGTRNIEYQITMYDRMSEMGDYKFRNSVDRRLKWSMCAKPHEFIEEIVKNLNYRDCGEWTTEGGVWSVGSCIDAAEKTIEFNHSYIDEALQSVADNFDTEWEMSDDFAVSLKKIEHNFDNPVALSYGRGNGFVPGVGRTSQSDEKPVKRLYVQGSDRNIDRSKYGGEDSEFPEYESTSADLRLPSAQTIRYDGSHFETEEGFNEDLARTYQTDADGYYVERTSPSNSAVKEDSLSCDEIYPSRVGTVTKVDAEVKGNPNFYDITDSSIPSSLNFKDYLLGEGDMTIIFQSGMLAGREFGVKYIHADKRFEIVPAEMDGMMMPNATFAPKEGDSYAIFGIMLPASYFRDNETKTGASWDMFREAVRYLYEHEDQKFTFTGELQGLWAKRNWGEIGGKLVVGGYVLFTDSQFATSGTKIRIKGIKTFVNSPYAPVIELTNSVSAGSRTASTLREVDNTEVVIDETEKRMKQFTLRRFRDAQETISMLDEAMLDNFTNSISPVAVQTMAMLVGDESLQFRFVYAYLEQYEDSEGNATTVTKYASLGDPVEYDETNMSIHINQSILEHLTLGITSIKSQHDSSEYKRWTMPEWDSAPLSEPEKSYYLYAAVEKTGTSGTYVISSKAIKFDGSGGGDSNVIVRSSRYYLLVGVINSEYDGKRSYVSLFGFTEILPGRITTDKIISNDGTCYFDLANNEIGGAIKFLSNNQYITLIDGGYINTQLINASELIANHIIAGDPEGQRVEITPDRKAVEIYDSNNNQVTILEGKKYSGVGTIFGDTSGSINVLQRSTEIFGYAAGVSLGRGNITQISGTDTSTSSYNKTINVSEAKHTETPTEITVSGYIELHANSYYKHTTNSGSGTGVPSQSTTPIIASNASISWTLLVNTYSDAACTNKISSATLAAFSAGANAAFKEDDYDSQTISQAFTKSVRVGAGYHRIILRVIQSAAGNGNNCYGSWGYTTGDRDDLSFGYKSDFYVSRYFANGFCLGTRADNYIIGYKDGDNGMRFMFANNHYEVDFSKDGLRYRINESGAASAWKYLT